MSDISDEDMKYLAENADRIVPYIPPGYFARIQAEALAARELKKKTEEEEKEREMQKNNEQKNDEKESENWENYDEEGNEKNEGWGGYPNEGTPIILHLSHFDYDKDGNLADQLTVKTDDEETGDYVGEVIARVEPQEVEQQEAKQQKAKEQTKQPSSKPGPKRKQRTNLSLLKPIPAFPGYKEVNIHSTHSPKAYADTKARNPDLRIKEDWTLPVDQVDWKYKLAVKDRKKAWKKASRRLKEGRGVVMTEVVQQPDQLET
ncbi:hypothetical protein K4K57_003742 [Colletotrichum sp. SAR 10_99]|nr:hypothetical protein K4K57_003742 [Colletotrichum sp. SAR 10_99]